MIKKYSNMATFDHTWDAFKGFSSLKQGLIALNAFMFLFLLFSSGWMSCLKEGKDVGCELDRNRVYNYSNLRKTVDCKDVFSDYIYKIPFSLFIFGLSHSIFLMFVYFTAILKTETMLIARFIMWIVVFSLYLVPCFYVYYNVLSFGHENEIYSGIPLYAPCTITHGIDSTREEICILRYPLNIKYTLVAAPCASLALVILYIIQAVETLRGVKNNS